MRRAVLKVVIAWFVDEVLNTGNLAAVDELFTADYVAHVPLDAEALRGDGAWKQRMAGYRAAFPDLHFTVEDLITERDTVAARLSWAGAHRGAFLGVPPTGRRVAVSGMAVWRIGDGRMAEEWVAEDLLGLLRDLGASTTPGHGQETAARRRD